MEAVLAGFEEARKQLPKIGRYADFSGAYFSTFSLGADSILLFMST